MVDNTRLNGGKGGNLIASDEVTINGIPVHAQRVKLIHGADGVSDGDVSNTNPFPVDPKLEKTAFGELAVADFTPTIQIQFPYNINTAILHDHSVGGSVSIENSMLKCSTGASANQTGALRTIESIQYRPGQGTLNRFTALFTTGIAGSTQEIGIGDTSDGFFFGYNGADFGVLRRSGGSVEIRTLTITTASTTAENITITLNGVAKTDVAVTASGVISTTANEIASATYPGWEAHSDGNGTVRFISVTSEPLTGTYSLSGATTAVGTFAQSVAGVSPTDTWVAQSSWNRDKADGTGELPVIDWTKGNVFEIRYQWLGFGPAYFYIENPETGRYVLCHVIEYANSYTVPSISNPTLPLSWKVENTSNTSDIVMYCGSSSAFVEGKVDNTHFHRGADVDYTAIGTTETPIISFHNKEIFQGKVNRITIRLILAVMNAEGTKPSTLRIRKAATLTGASWTDVETDVSVIEVDTSATAVSGGNKQLAIGLSKSGQVSFDLEEKSYLLRPGEIFTITGQATSGTIEGTISLNWEELH